MTLLVTSFIKHDRMVGTFLTLDFKAGTVVIVSLLWASL